MKSNNNTSSTVNATVRYDWKHIPELGDMKNKPEVL